MRTLIRTAVAAAAAFGVAVLTAAPAAAAPSGPDTTWMKAAPQGTLAELAAGEAASSTSPCRTRPRPCSNSSSPR